ncbi:DUF309 domain-containing protein [Blastopirellula marina]|uniref:DUF309 domain-containing protein n=1 Tax=Blastopirellula marina TaxID=124 RepID=A0A2S8GIQ9_9BACT|nr:DUF309 domain-containing protein [Blastopirellula marina]PQO44318.1 DUF309 domain-containing protein [Blastopirellula marina]
MKRYVPHLPLPPYAYVPGIHPHPISHPDGHSYRTETPPLDLPAELRSCESFLVGIDLFNAGYYWEAHEAWEPIWLAQKRSAAPREPIQGLILLAAAGVKAREGSAAGVARHADLAHKRLKSADASSLPLNLDELRNLAILTLDQADRILNTEPAPVVVIFPTAIILVD